ncbi:MAG: Response regulator containing chey-like receiver [Fibrobacteres bacterium]|nr:Response regulator containing chey-like receiver [Fibrobacterota bacterium]
MIHAPGSPLEATLRLAEAAARRDCPVFLRGESGSGKEMLARFLHDRGGRAAGPLVAVNCAALPHSLIESELFGHRKGAFTGAVADNPGKFRRADGGTLFLDEIGDMPLDVQTRLLRALQEKTVCPVGDSREYPVDFRLVCATHRDLRAEVRDGRFREDLFYRLNVVEIRLPPLRERIGDIPPLLRHFLASMLPEGDAEAAFASLPPDLLSLPFPGNVRELRNLAERFCVLREMGGGWPDAVTQMLPSGPEKGPIPGSGANPARLRNSRLTDAEIIHALEVCGHHRTRASDFLGITRRALQYRLAGMGRRITDSLTL